MDAVDISKTVYGMDFLLEGRFQNAFPICINLYTICTQKNLTNYTKIQQETEFQTFEYSFHMFSYTLLL